MPESLQPQHALSGHQASQSRQSGGVRLLKDCPQSIRFQQVLSRILQAGRKLGLQSPVVLLFYKSMIERVARAAIPHRHRDIGMQHAGLVVAGIDDVHPLCHGQHLRIGE